MDPIEAARALVTAADALLAQTGLFEILERHGRVRTTGSYAYDLMTWRDIDLCLSVPEPTVALMFRIGTEIGGVPDVATMYFRNEYVLRTRGNPRGMFWCVEILDDDRETWKVDILVAEPDEVERIVSRGRERIRGMTAEQREAILRIKSELCTDPDYRRGFGSTAIYEAVLEAGVRSLEDWHAWRSVR